MLGGKYKMCQALLGDDLMSLDWCRAGYLIRKHLSYAGVKRMLALPEAVHSVMVPQIKDNRDVACQLVQVMSSAHSFADPNRLSVLYAGILSVQSRV